MVFGLLGKTLAENVSISQTQPLITNTPSLQVQRVSVTPKTLLADQQQHQYQHLQQPQQNEPISSLPLVHTDQGLVSREEQSNIYNNNNKKLPIKVDVSVRVVPKPKTKKSRNQKCET